MQDKPNPSSVSLDLDAIRARAEWLVYQWTAPAFGRTKFHDAAVVIARNDVPALLSEVERLREALGEIAHRVSTRRTGVRMDGSSEWPMPLHGEVYDIARAALAAQETEA